MLFIIKYLFNKDKYNKKHKNIKHNKDINHIKDNKYNDLITKINNFNNKNIRIEELSPHEILNLVI